MAKYTDLESMKEKFPQSGGIPACWSFMQPEFIEYVEGESLTLAFPVLEVYANPRGSMQGGFIAAAFDNTLGALVLRETGRHDMASVDLHVNFQRPIFVGDSLLIRVQVKSIGQTLIHVCGEGVDRSRGRLIATAASNLILFGADKFAKKKKAGPQAE